MTGSTIPGHNGVRLIVDPTRGVILEHTGRLDRFDGIVTELQRRHPGFRRTTIERLVDRLAAQYQEARIQAFVAVLVRREAEAQLRYVEGLALADDPSERHAHLLRA